MDCNGEPHLVFVANKTIEIGEELLFDYNDRKSQLSFLKSCPICKPHATQDETQPADDTLVASEDECTYYFFTFIVILILYLFYT